MKPVGIEDRRSAGLVPDEQTAWAVGFLSGLVVAAVGALDIGLLFYPAQWASLDWEFGTISGLIEGMPLLTLGFAAMTVAATASGWNRWCRFLSVVGLLMALLVLAMLVIYAFDLPAAFRAVQPAMRSPVKKAVFKTAVMGLMYLVFYATLGVWTWRRLTSLSRLRGAG